MPARYTCRSLTSHAGCLEMGRSKSVIQALSDVLVDTGYRRAAERLQAEIRGLPELDTAMSALESLCLRSDA
jgi:UDP:flavonoid glycosyltransferase YjiC (YdhE family)